MSGKTIVITGASSGFGRLTAEHFQNSGWHTIVGIRNVSGKNAGAAAELRALGITVVELDVSTDASVEAAAQDIVAAAGAPDVIVHNAGIAHFGIQETFSAAKVEQTYQTNVFGPLRVNRAFLPSMREKKSGLIVYVSSVVGRIVRPFGGVYASSKWAIEALAEASSYELAPFNIDVAIVEPGAYVTGIFGNTEAGDDSGRAAQYGTKIAELAAGTPAMIAKAAAGNDPADISNLIYALAEMPAGTRPLRSVSPENPAVVSINDFLAPIQQKMVESYGVPEIVPAALHSRE